MGDKELISAIKNNPEQGFRLLLRAYEQPLYWHIRRMVAAHDDARDATQETFIRVYRSIGQYSGRGSFRAWLFRIATGEALRLLSRRAGCAEVSLDDAPAELFELKADAYFDGSDRLAVRLQKAVLSLPAKQQLAFNLRYYDEMPYEDIAHVIGSTPAAAKMNYHLAKERIIKIMNNEQTF